MNKNRNIPLETATHATSLRSSDEFCSSGWRTMYTCTVVYATTHVSSAGYMATGDVYSRGGQSAAATPSGPPGTAQSAGTASKPGSDYGPASYGSAYGSYSDYSARSTAPYGTADSTGGYSSQPPQAAGGKHFTDFKEWPASWQPIDGQGTAPAAVPGTGLAVRAVSAAVVELSHWPQIGQLKRDYVDVGLNHGRVLLVTKIFPCPRPSSLHVPFRYCAMYRSVSQLLDTGTRKFISSHIFNQN